MFFARIGIGVICLVCLGVGIFIGCYIMTMFTSQAVLKRLIEKGYITEEEAERFINED